MHRRSILKIFGAGIVILTLAAVWNDRDYNFQNSTAAVFENARHRPNYKAAHGRTEVSSGVAAATQQPVYTDLRGHDNHVQCKLEWNVEKLNVSLYEADRIIFDRSSDNLGRNYRPSLVNANPQIILDRNAYLLPDLIWGPNNQLVGFFESIFVAIKLNRTLVLPSFLKHNTDRQFKRGSRNRISPLHRVDIHTLCRYISCVTLDQFHRYCNYQIDGIINIRLLKAKDLATIESDTKMKISRDEGSSSIDEILIPTNGTNPKNMKLIFSGREIASLFKSKARCVVYPFPFFDVMGYDKNGERRVLYSMVGSNTLQNPSAPSDVRLMSDIINHTPRPSYVQNIASEFIHFMTNDERFLSAHWRYNEGDYLSSWHCGNKEINKKRCEKARNYTSNDFAKRLIDKTIMLSKRELKVSSIYIATPRSELGFIQKTVMSLREFEVNLQVFNSNDLEKFIKRQYPGCDFLSSHFEDILSSIEMEVCSRSVAFLGSLGTTWSGNVFKSRMITLNKSQHEISPDYIFRI